MDPRVRLQRGQEAAAAGRYEEALQDYIWFHEHALKQRPSLYGVRLSFALWYWVELGKQYPKAKTALKRIRDDKTKRLLSGERSRDLFHDVAAINQMLGTERATYKLFAALETANPQFASRCADLALRCIVQARDFAMAQRYMPSPGDELRRYGRLFSRDIRRKPKSKAPRLQAYAQIYAERLQLLLKILRGTNQTEEANALEARALEPIKSASVRKVIRRALQGAA